MAESVPISDGVIPFDVPGAGKDCFTYYKVFGRLSDDNIPLIALHGGPGAGHEYLQVLGDLTAQNQTPIILYDQLGCGKSTALREKDGDWAFWTVELFEQELHNLIHHFELRRYDLLGHSWGGELASMFASKHPAGLRKLVLMSAPASTKLSKEGMARLQKELPATVQKTLQEHEERQDYGTPEYKEACMEFYKRFLCRMNPWPKELMQSMAHLDEDPTVYGTLLGPSELVCTGVLKDWTAIPHAHRIQAPTLLLNGEFDEVTETAMAPFFAEIPKVKWFVIPNSSHMNMWEQRGKVMEVISTFIMDQ